MATPRKPQDRKAPTKQVSTSRYDLDLDALEDTSAPLRVRIFGQEVLFRGAEDLDAKLFLELDAVDQEDNLALLEAGISLLRAAVVDPKHLEIVDTNLGLRKINALLQAYMDHNELKVPDQGEGDGSSTS